MKILHTSDWHIGKRLMGRQRLDEQAQVLDEIVGVCDSEKVELVLIAGDIFDTYTPCAEAEELFFAKIKKIATNRAVLIISGNHDDGVRLSAVSPLSEEQGVYLIGNARLPVSIKQTDRAVRPTQSGKGYTVFENAQGEKVYIATLPYPNEARFKEEKSTLQYAERIRFWIDESVSGNTDNLPSILLAHIFVAGGKVSESEREIDLGGLRAVGADDLPKVQYIALGHLHKKQHIGKGHCYYSGSPLQYSFDESADKSVKVFNLTLDGVQDLKDIPLQSGKKLIRLQADSAQGANALLKNYPNCWVELRLILNAPLTSSDATMLAQNENLVSLLTEVTSEQTMEFQSRKGLSDSELFDAFYKNAYGAQPKAEVKRIFLTTLNELQND